MKHTIYTRNDQKTETVTPAMRALIKKAICQTLETEHFRGSAEVSVTFVDNEKIRELNRQFRQIDRATDVLSFPLTEEDSEDGFDQDMDTNATVLGDIVLSVERAKEQAKEYGHSLDRELAFLSVHSVLHLLGYDHERSAEEDQLMQDKQEAVLVSMGLKRD